MLVSMTVSAASAPALIPAPRRMEVREGSFTLNSATRLHTDAACRTSAELLAERLRRSTGFALRIEEPSSAASPAGGFIRLTTEAALAELIREGYQLTVAPGSVVIRAPESAGVFYGVQTFLQLLPADVFATNPVADQIWQAPCLDIEDQPRRGETVARRARVAQD
jgi:hexosaminidase